MQENEHLTAPLRVDRAELAEKIRDGLLKLGFTGDAMRAAVPESAEASTSMHMDHAMIAERLGTGSAVACLLRAFLLRAATPEAVLREKLGDEFFELCDEAGLWSRVEDGITGTVVFLEDEKIFLLSDHTSLRLGELEMYWVMSIGTSTIAVANSVARRPYGKVLDLCCGGGIQAFYAAPYAKQIVAIDRNPRALNLGRFGAAMNRLPNIEFRESDCYSAVAGETFDLVVCNPPYVMTPDRQAYYRDGGMGGDRFSERILREVPAYMSEGGFTHVTCDVGGMGGKSSQTRLREWLDGNGCDVVALAGKRLTPGEYAKAWMRADRGPHVQEEIARWTAYLEEIGIEEIQNWLLVLRKRTGGQPNWFLRETLSARQQGTFGHQIARMFACQDLLRQGDAALWRAKLRLAKDVRMIHTVRPEGSSWMADSSRITFAGGLIQEFEVDPRTAPLLLLYDGTRKSEDVLARVALQVGGKVNEMRDGWLGYVKHLAANGILEPAAG